jgi:glycyl-tRNA synthetase beta chain
MTHRVPLLIEIGCEELPPRALDELATSLRDGITGGLTKRGIAFDAEGVTAYWTPRRMAVLIANVAVEQPDQQQERRGPAANQGFDASGKPTKALIGFAQSVGVDVAALEKLETDKGAWYVHRSIKKGALTSRLVPEILAEALKALPIPKPMRWGDREDAFVRPVHWLVLLLGDSVVDCEIFGIKADRMSRGHRFHHPGSVWISTAEAYVDALRKAKVLVDPAERRERIRERVTKLVHMIAVQGSSGPVKTELGLKPRMRDELLDEVKNLVEWPAPIACTFERDFLRVPQEALIMTMEANQKFFPVLDAQDRLTEHFIGIANIESRDPDEIRKGYERVIRPRFADARFFFDDDLKTPLASQQAALERVTYQQKLGSVWDKCTRVAELARTIAGRVGVDAARATRAAALSKCDLMTRMVGEFPELQGVMGRYYAAAQNEHAEVAQALDEFYAPRFAGDRIAQGKVAQVLAVAEKLDTLAGLFAVGQKPTGNKDPFSLRRNALGLARTLIEGKLEFDIVDGFEFALDLCKRHQINIAQMQGFKDKDGVGTRTMIEAFGREVDRDAVDLYHFVLDRLRGYYQDQGVPPTVFDAVAAVEPTLLSDFDRRVHALVEFRKLPDAEALAAANKRIGNILRQASEKGEVLAKSIDDTVLAAPEERALAAALRFQGDIAQQALMKRDYVAALKQLASLRAPIDAFFEQVMVMADDPRVRANRLALLSDLRQRFMTIADISVL